MLTDHKRGSISAIVAATVFLSGCVGGMIPGTIYAPSGKVLQFSIEKSYGSGAVTAYDPETSEVFNGTYVGILPRQGVSFTSGSAFVSGTAGSNIGNATAFLKGDKGGMLTCEMQIQVGLSPHGLGTCKDRSATEYRLQF